MMTDIDHAKAIEENQWQALLVFNFYRLALSLFLIISFYVEFQYLYRGSNYPNLFLSASILYLSFSLLCFVLIYYRKPRFDVQVVFQVFFDIVILTALMRANNGATSSLGVLINIAIAGGSMLTPGRISLLFAAIATISVLSEITTAVLMGNVSPHDFVGAAVLCATFFATAILAFVLSRRIRMSEALASARKVDIATLEKLNSHIIHLLRSGIIVVRANNSVRLINDAAMSLLSYNSGESNPESEENGLAVVSSIVAHQLKEWRKPPHRQPNAFRLEPSGLELIAQFSALENDFNKTVLIFLDDSARTAKQAQEMKLLSLGRLSASIAHEIRNPLGAISHAAQLLEETESLEKSERRFVDIIRTNSDRMNGIINSILQLSKRKQASLTVVHIKPWLERFSTDFSNGYGEECRIKLNVVPDNLELRVDNTQLQQILSNLCENGLRYSKKESGEAVIELNSYLHDSTGKVTIDVVDYGPGIKDDVAENLFEPFFTTNHQGTGLGLYVAKELCEANSARLEFYNREEGGCCFRITFYT